MLTIFYDGQCPLCSAEMRSLKAHDKDDHIKLVDLHSECFSSEYPEVDFDDAMAILHGQYRGQTLRGLAVTHRAWTLAGKGFWVAPLNWPVIKPLSHWVYLLLARYRHPISALLARVFNISTKACDSGICHKR